MMKYKVSVIIETEHIDPSALLESIQYWAEDKTDDEELSDDSATVEELPGGAE